MFPHQTSLEEPAEIRVQCISGALHSNDTVLIKDSIFRGRVSRLHGRSDSRCQGEAAEAATCDRDGRRAEAKALTGQSSIDVLMRPAALHLHVWTGLFIVPAEPERAHKSKELRRRLRPGGISHLNDAGFV